jgi:hypothetical protein
LHSVFQTNGKHPVGAGVVDHFNLAGTRTPPGGPTKHNASSSNTSRTEAAAPTQTMTRASILTHTARRCKAPLARCMTRTTYMVHCCCSSTQRRSPTPGANINAALHHWRMHAALTLCAWCADARHRPPLPIFPIKIKCGQVLHQGIPAAIYLMCRNVRLDRPTERRFRRSDTT